MITSVMSFLNFPALCLPGINCISLTKLLIVLHFKFFLLNAYDYSRAKYLRKDKVFHLAPTLANTVHVAEVALYAEKCNALLQIVPIHGCQEENAARNVLKDYIRVSC